MIRHNEASKRIGLNLKKIRQYRRLMQIDVAVAVDMNRTYISRIETGKARVTIRLLHRLIMALEITSTDLIEYPQTSYSRDGSYNERGSNYGS